MKRYISLFLSPCTLQFLLLSKPSFFHFFIFPLTKSSSSHQNPFQYDSENGTGVFIVIVSLNICRIYSHLTCLMKRLHNKCVSRANCSKDWDNSTRGLDASTSLDYAKSLRIMTNIYKTTTFVSLYQASANIYKQFDKVLVIDAGREVYFGLASDLFLTSI